MITCGFIGSIGWPEALIILVIVVVIFGAKRLPEIGRGIGQSVREFKAEYNSDKSDQAASPRLEKEGEHKS